MKLIVQGDSSVPEALGSILKARISSTPMVSYDDGSARFQMIADSVSYRSDQRSVEECAHIERSLDHQDFQFKMDGNGDMQDLRMGEFVPELEQTDIDLRRLLLKLQPVLPGGAVELGDTWERQQLLSDQPGEQAFVYKWFQVEDIFEHKGKRMVKMRMNIKYKLDDSTSIRMHLQGRDFILGSGDVLFNATDGQIQDASLEISGSLNVLSASKHPGTTPPMQVRQILRLRRLS